MTDTNAVFEHVRSCLASGGSVRRRNSRNAYGPANIADALVIDTGEVKRALGILVAQQRLILVDGGYTLGPGLPGATSAEASPRPDALPLELARRIGIVGGAEEQPEPIILLDHALRWAKRRLHVFPAVRFLGTPLVERWYHDATTAPGQIIEWWTAWRIADIAAVPDRSGHFVIIACGDDGAESLAAIEAEYGELPTDFRYRNEVAGSEHLWLKGQAVTSHHRLGSGLHVIGAGHYVYLPPSWAPDHHYEQEGNDA